MNRIVDIIKTEYLKPDAPQTYIDEVSSLIEASLNYMITLDQDKPNDGENVLVIGFSEYCSDITCVIAKYNREKNIFFEGDNLFRAIAWRPLPKLKICMPND